jgi:hypothetical protein
MNTMMYVGNGIGQKLFLQTKDPKYLVDWMTGTFTVYDGVGTVSVQLHWFTLSPYSNSVRWKVTLVAGQNTQTKYVTDDTIGEYRLCKTDALRFDLEEISTHWQEIDVYVERDRDHVEDTLSENAYLMCIIFSYQDPNKYNCIHL